VEKAQEHTDPSLSGGGKDPLKKRIQARLAQHEEYSKEADRERRAGRLQGELTQSLKEKLSNCTVLQLQNAKKLCDSFIKRQRQPPLERYCGDKSTVGVLRSVTVKAIRFRLEFRRTSLTVKKVYVNGPFVWRYWWDGSIVKSKYIKKDKHLRQNLPKKVWLEFRDVIDCPENAATRQTLLEKLNREDRQ
jgi:hypothetical protein